MSTANSVYSGLSWIGETQAKISFYGVLIFAIIFAVIMIINIISNTFLLYSSKSSQKQKTVKEKIVNLTKVLFILLLIFGVILGLLYWNMEEAEHSKAYAATEGAIDIANDIRRI